MPAAPARLTRRLLRRIGLLQPRPFLILSRSRTGSNLLTSYLKAHPNVRIQGEIFSRLEGRDYREILGEAFARPGSPDILAQGFKLFYYHPLDDRESPLWDDLVAMRRLHVLHLKRRNMLRTQISRKLADEQDVWVLNHPEAQTRAPRKAVSFTPEELAQKFERTRQWEREGARRFQGHPMLTLHYEDLAARPRPVFRRVTRFLGLPPSKPKTRLRKQNPETARQLVENYDALKAAFADSEWAEFFEE